MKTVASVVSGVNGLWTLVAGIYVGTLMPTSYGVDISNRAGNDLLGIILMALGIALLLDSVVCLLGYTRAFYVSAGFSVLVVLSELLFAVDRVGLPFLAGLALGALTIILDLVAGARKRYVSEENHPLNLPVFG